MIQDKIKKMVGWAALHYVPNDTIIGIGTGSTITYFIDALSTIKNRLKGVVSTSDSSTKKLKSLGFSICELNKVDDIAVYIDGADEINPQMQMIKGGGGALTSEKIVAAAAKKFVCIADDSKEVKILGNFPLPIEIIPMACSFVSRELIKFGGLPKYRNNFITDHGNIILDVHNLCILDPLSLEQAINALPGVVTVGLFAKRSADIALIGTINGIKTIIK